MLEELASANKFVGIKQSTRAITESEVKKAYVARDADDQVKIPFLSLCSENKVEVVWVDSMEQLGEACGITVGAAVAVTLKDSVSNAL